jgi:putative flippase GtrA
MFLQRSSNIFIKAQLSSFISTLADFLLTRVLTEWMGIWYLLSSILGTISGGYVNFLLGRYWVFKGRKHKKLVQAGRYTLIWIGNLALNTMGVYVFTELLQLHYMISKALVSIAVGVFYNYQLQKSYVFQA